MQLQDSKWSFVPGGQPLKPLRSAQGGKGRDRGSARVNGSESFQDGRSGESMVQVQVPSKLTSGAQCSAACTENVAIFHAFLCPGVAPDTNGTGMICFQSVMAVPNVQFLMMVYHCFPEQDSTPGEEC